MAQKTCKEINKVQVKALKEKYRKWMKWQIILKH
jgi:hypothetical protein